MYSKKVSLMQLHTKINNNDNYNNYYKSSLANSSWNKHTTAESLAGHSH